jgi:hypothetical protein
MTGHDYDAITRAIKELPLGRQLKLVREIVSAKDFGVFTCDATNAIDFALDDMDAQAIEMLREDDIAIHGAEA